MAAARIQLALLLLLSIVICTAARSLTETSSSIEVPEEERFELHESLHARGYQYYRFNGTIWVPFNASARLYNAENKAVGRHFFLTEPDAKGGQPTWESSSSSVTCKTLATKTVDSHSIQWVLLKKTQSHGSKKHFGAVVFVQRVNTKLGLPPRWISGASVGDVKKSPYSSDYLFYVSRKH